MARFRVFVGLFSLKLTSEKINHVGFSLNGVEIFANGSGSHHQLRKLEERLGLIQGAARKVGRVYLYANQQGCDGGRIYYGPRSLYSLLEC